MKGFTIFLILVIIVVAGYFVLRKPNDEMVTPTDETGDAMPSESSNETPNENLSGTKTLDSEKSSAKWTGSKTLVKDYYDVGTIDIKSGTAIFAKGVLTGGSVVFDMNSIATTSTGKGSDADATSSQAKHMKSDDFFDAAKYPEAKFVITSAAKESGNAYLLNGDLTIKDKTNPVSFPAEVTESNGIATIEGSVTLDRTLWDIKYGSDKFFQDLGDKVINDDFTLEFTAVTK